MCKKVLTGLMVLGLVFGGISLSWALDKKPAKNQEPKAEVKKVEAKSESKIKSSVKQAQAATFTLLWEKEFEQNIGNISMTGDGEHIVVDTIPDKTGTNKIFLFDKSGNVIWQHSSTEYGKDYLSRSTIVRNGSNILTLLTDYEECWNRKLICLDQNGNLLWQSERLVPGDFSMSADGEYILVAYEIEDLYVLLFNKNGTQLWGKEDIMGAPIISGDGNYILIYNQLFSKNGNLLWEKDKFIGSGISTNGNTIVGWYRNTIRLFNPSGNILGEYSCSDENETIYPIVSPNGNYLIASNSQNKVYFFDRNATLLWEKNYNNIRPLSIITDDGGYCAVAYGNLNIDILNQSGNAIGQIRLEGEGKLDLIMVWSSDGKHLAITERGKKLYFYDNSSIIK